MITPLPCLCKSESRPRGHGIKLARRARARTAGSRGGPASRAGPRSPTRQRREPGGLAAGLAGGHQPWFNPLAWWAQRRLRQEAERACDDAVLPGGVQPSAHARVLPAQSCKHPGQARPTDDVSRARCLRTCRAGRKEERLDCPPGGFHRGRGGAADRAGPDQSTLRIWRRERCARRVFPQREITGLRIAKERVGRDVAVDAVLIGDAPGPIPAFVAE